MFTVALIGPDGAGKSTISRRLEQELPFPARALYMGVNLESGGPMLPTTRLVLELKRLRGLRTDIVASSNGGGGRGARRALKTTARLAFWMAEEWYRQLHAERHRRRGTVVIFDRHFYADYFHDDVVDGPRPLARRLHGFVLERLYPKPDLAVCLDAPGEVLYARKREASPEWLESRRRQYLQLAERLPAFAVVDAARDLDAVVADVARIVGEFRRSRQRNLSIPPAPERPTIESTR